MPDERAATEPGVAAAPHAVRVAAWDLRVLRALPFAAVCTLAGAAGHASASGGAVPAWALAAGFAAVCTAAALLGGRERSLAAIAGGLAVGQVVLHLLFHAAQGAMPASPAGSGRATLLQVAGRLLCGAHHAGGVPVLPPGAAEQLLSRAGLDPSVYAASPSYALSAALPWWQQSVLGLSPLMLAGHVLAALAAGWWLRRGEAALWRLVRLAGAALGAYAAPLRTVLALAGRLLRGMPGGEPVRPVRARRRERGGWGLPLSAALRYAVVRRGPPVAVPAL